MIHPTECNFWTMIVAPGKRLKSPDFVTVMALLTSVSCSVMGRPCPKGEQFQEHLVLLAFEDHYNRVASPAEVDQEDRTDEKPSLHEGWSLRDR